MTLPPIISDHMVLQRSARTAVWGRDTPGAEITVALGTIQSRATADASGAWKVELDLSSVTQGPFELHIVGTVRITVADVLVGEVWLCAGQSNIAFTLDRAVGGADEVAQSANARLRQFRVTPNATNEPAADCAGSWMVASPSTAAQFSAVGYYFAKDVQRALDSPVGIILSAWAGSVATAWISRATLDADVELKNIADKSVQLEADYPLQKAAYVAGMLTWEIAHARQDRAADRAAFNSIQNMMADWKLVSFPAAFEQLGLADAGAVWIRRAISITPKPAI